MFKALQFAYQLKKTSVKQLLKCLSTRTSQVFIVNRGINGWQFATCFAAREFFT